MPAALLERDDELAAVERMLADARAGEGRMLVIEGPAGIGKSRVLAEVRSQATRMQVLAARAGELEQAFPFGVVRQLLEGVLSDPERAERVFAGAAAPAREALGAPEHDPDPAAAGGASFAVLHGLYWLVLNLAEEQPLLLSVDDLQWCDPASLRFLAYLVRRVEGTPILLATTLRSAEPGTDPSLLAELLQDPMTEPLHPGPLSETAAGAMIADRLGQAPDPGFVAACHRATGGNPLLLGQLLAALRADHVPPTAEHARAVRDIAPRAVSRTVLLRLGRLSEDAIAVARAVAILGDGADPPTVAAYAELPEARVAEVSGELARAEILQPEPPLDFVHPLVREAVYRELPPAARDLAHGQAARVLAGVGAEPERIATQLLRTLPRGEAWTAEQLHQAGAAARRRGAPEATVEYLRRALEEPPAPDLHPTVLLELGFAEAGTDLISGAAHLSEARAGIDDPEVRFAVGNALVDLLLFSGRMEESMRLARQLLAELPPGDDRGQRLEAFRICGRLWGLEDDEALEIARAARDEPVGDGPGARVLAGLRAMVWMYDGGSAEECAPLALAAVGDGQLRMADDPLLSVAGVWVLAFADRHELDEFWRRARVDAHRTGSLFLEGAGHGWYGFTCLRRGDLAEALEETSAAVEALTRWGFESIAMGFNTALLSAAQRERGELAAAAAALDRTPPPPVGSFASLFWLDAKARLLVEQGDPEGALAAIAEQAAGNGWRHAPVDQLHHVTRARALERLGRHDDALAAGREALEIARRWGAPGVLGEALRVLGQLEGEEGLPRLREAVDVLDGSPARLELAKALAAYGGALRRGRQPTEAREPLRRALELASACDAAALADHARTELGAAGARPRSDAQAGVEALTPSERRVVDLAADGQANREIAQTLYVTPKTVEVHLTNAYRKLGIRSRRELAGAMAGAT